MLVVEDDPQINQLIGAYGQLCGIEYRSALTGGAALRELAARRPTVMILDLMLPDVEGLEICRQAKRLFNGQPVPVIILSALAGEEDLERGFAAGADDYLTKPFDPEALITILRRFGGVCQPP